MPFECKRCTRSYLLEDEYNTHIKSNKCKEPYECKACKYITARKSSYDKHIQTKKCKDNITKLENKKSKYICKFCNKSFRDNYILSRHLNRKTPCVNNQTMNINNGTINNNNVNGSTINSNNKTIIINAHDPMAFLKNLNKIDQAIYNNMLQSHSINSPESIALLEKLALDEPYHKPRLMDPDADPDLDRDLVEEVNNKNIKSANDDYISNIFCKAFFNVDKLRFTPFFKIPNTKEIKIKYDNQLHDFSIDTILELISNFESKVMDLREEKNIGEYVLENSILRAYEDFRMNFLKLFSRYTSENKKIQRIINSL